MESLAPNLIFLHIPKAGGSTLRKIFLDQHHRVNPDPESFFVVNRTRDSQNLYDLSQERKKKIKLLIGHFGFGVHEELKGASQYVTMLRNPIARVLSAYNYSKSFERADAFEAIRESNMDVVEFAQHYGGSWLINGQTRILAGLGDNTSLSDKELYTIALQNIKDHFIYVGALESFDRSLLQLKKVLNWSTPYYTIQNKTLEKTSIKPSSLQKIQALVKYDMDLYLHCNQCFLSKGGVRERYALSKFKLLNKVYGITR